MSAIFSPKVLKEAGLDPAGHWYRLDGVEGPLLCILEPKVGWPGHLPPGDEDPGWYEPDFRIDEGRNKANAAILHYIKYSLGLVRIEVPEIETRLALARMEGFQTAMILANNLCVQESDRFNNDDEIQESTGASSCVARIKDYLFTESNEVDGLVAEAAPARASLMKGVTIFLKAKPDWAIRGVKDPSGKIRVGALGGWDFSAPLNPHEIDRVVDDIVGQPAPIIHEGVSFHQSTD